MCIRDRGTTGRQRATRRDGTGTGQAETGQGQAGKDNKGTTERQVEETTHDSKRHNGVGTQQHRYNRKRQRETPNDATACGQTNDGNTRRDGHGTAQDGDGRFKIPVRALQGRHRSDRARVRACVRAKAKAISRLGVTRTNPQPPILPIFDYYLFYYFCYFHFLLRCARLCYCVYVQTMHNRCLP